MTEIVKVQLPLASNDPNPKPLVYDKHQKRVVQQPIDHATKVAMGSDAKAFFSAEYRPSQSRWSIGARVKDPGW